MPEHVYKDGCSKVIFDLWERHSILVKSGVATIAVLLVKYSPKKSYSNRVCYMFILSIFQLVASASASYLVHKVKESKRITRR